MISNPNLILYACVSKGTTILGEFNHDDEEDDLSTLALQCLEKTPPLHSLFSHTVRNRTYTFLIADPFVFFAISDEKLPRSDSLSFLTSLKRSFDAASIPKENFYKPLCFQGELSLVFHRLLSAPGRGETTPSKRLLKKRKGEGRDGVVLRRVNKKETKRVWKRHVWVVLSLDLIACSILFGVWLWICRGFQCIDG